MSSVFVYQEVKDKLFNELEERIDHSGNIYQQAYAILDEFDKENHEKYGMSRDEIYRTFELDVDDWLEYFTDREEW